MRFGVAGAGLSGAVVARELADAGHRVVIHEQRDHIAGNVHTERERDTGVMIHRYGPHIFHTANRQVWEYANRHATMMPFVLRVRSIARGEVYSLPVNLSTLNQVFRTALSPAQAQRMIEQDRVPIDCPANFEEAALAAIGPTLYELLFKGYTAKQWGRDPSSLPASVFRRLPIRFTYDDNYFDHPWQGIPRDGYTAMVESILAHENITVRLGSEFPVDAGFDHVIWTGPLDAWFAHAHGRLGYRTLTFQRVMGSSELQGCPVMNYADPEVPWTRITEHKHFAPWDRPGYSVAMIERSHNCGPDDEPYYPIRLAADESMLGSYLDAAAAEQGVSFVGRLGTYRYLDMDVAIAEALHAARVILTAVDTAAPIPALTHKENHP